MKIKYKNIYKCLEDNCQYDGESPSCYWQLSAI